MNKFYVYMVLNRYVVVGEKLQLKLTSKIDNASFWTNKRQAKTWSSMINKAYPNARLEEAKLTTNF